MTSLSAVIAQVALVHKTQTCLHRNFQELWTFPEYMLQGTAKFTFISVNSFSGIRGNGIMRVHPKYRARLRFKIKRIRIRRLNYIRFLYNKALKIGKVWFATLSFNTGRNPQPSRLQVEW